MSQIFSEFSGNICLGTSKCMILFHGHQLNLLAIQPFVCKNITSFSPVNAIAYQVTWTNAKSLGIMHLVTLPNAIDGSNRLELWYQLIRNYHFWSVDMITSWQIGWIKYKSRQGKSEGFDSCDQPSNLKLDSNRQFFSPCDLGIW